MIRKDNCTQNTIEMVVLEDLVPSNHLLRKIDAIIDERVIRKELEPFYCDNNGRPAVDPVILFKIFLIGFIYGIRSERQLMRDIEVNLAYRWFLGYNISDTIPHHSTLSKNRLHRFQGSDVFRKIFDNTVFMAMKRNLVSGHTLYTDSTHLKANANKNKFKRQEVEGTAKKYLDELEEAVSTDRSLHGKKPLKPSKKKSKAKITRVSTTDPESGFLMRNGKEECFAYLDHRTVDGKYNIITDVHITSGNVHDSVPYIDRLDFQINKFGFDVKQVGLDAGYNSAYLCHQLCKRDILGVIGYRRFSSKKGFIKKRAFQYNKEKDIYVCPQGETLKYKTTSREGYRHYNSNPERCKHCEFLGRCTENKKYIKTITRHVWEDDKEAIDQNRLTDKGKRIYRRRKETVERSFADAKQLHGYRYARYRGIWRVEFQSLMTAICQNLKKMAILNDNHDGTASSSLVFSFLQILLAPKSSIMPKFCYVA